MTDSNRSLNEVPALLDERRRYEGWLAALEARRESTPAHVFERVQSDYRDRLQRVDEQIASYRQAIDEERTSVQSRLSLLQAEEQMRRDERAELELRSHVGELSGTDAEESFRVVNEALDKLDGERKGLERRMAELDGLLENRPPDMLAAPAVESAPSGEPAVEPVVAEKDEPMVTRSQQTPGGSFDELAFLNTVVGEDGTPRGVRVGSESALPAQPSAVSEPTLRSTERAAESLLAGLGQPRQPGAEPPLAANVPANTPIMLRTSGPIEPSKTLKCNECGSMNYPTEWYCERCGAELAAL